MDGDSIMQNENWGRGGENLGTDVSSNMGFDGAGFESAPITSASNGIVSSNEPKQKKAKGNNILVGLTVVFGLLAIVGLTFGVVMMVNGNKRAEDLVSQVDELEVKNDDLLEQLADRIASVENEPAIQIQPVIIQPEDYIYVGEWGIKIKKPENWRSLVQEYTFYNDYPQSVDTLEIKENPEVPTSHALIVNEGETTCENISVNYDACFMVGTYAFIVTGLPEIGTGGVTDEFRNFVLNSDNYSPLWN